MASDDAAMKAQLKPWTPRAMNSHRPDCAAPPTIDVTPNRIRAATNTLRWPSWSAARPPSIRKLANRIA